MKFLARLALLLLGLALLLPGACALLALPAGLSLLPDLFAHPEQLADAAPVAAIWLIGLLAGAFGVWLLAQIGKV